MMNRLFSVVQHGRYLMNPQTVTGLGRYNGFLGVLCKNNTIPQENHRLIQKHLHQDHSCAQKRNKYQHAKIHSSGLFQKFDNNAQNSNNIGQRRHIVEDHETKALTVWTNLKELKSSPLPALVLGFSGLIPFVSAPVYMTMSQLYLPQVAFAQLAYGAAILSFLGGVRWGFVIPEETATRPNWFNLGYSVTPSLVAWIGLMLPDPANVLTVMAGLAGAAYFDTALPGYPPWFKGMRFVLSFVAVISLWTSFMCKFFLKSNSSQEN